MPKCYKCNAPIIFVHTVNNWSHTLSEKSVPLNIDPDASNGSVSLFKWPVTFRDQPLSNGGERTLVGRRQGGEALSWLRRQGAALYRVHFDTCTGR